MRVLVTGATGFVGAWTAKAIEDAGHEVRLFVRKPQRLTHSAALIGVDTSDRAIGDITDERSVRRALDGCDGLVHAAAVVATDPRRAAEMFDTNLAGARNVLGTAVELGLDPVVHVSSITALFETGLELMHADLPVAGGSDAYGRSKAAVDVYARELQEQGAPVTITYPGMVLGPPAGDQFGEVAEGIETLLKTGVLPGLDAGWTVVDVRDLAALHAALMEPGHGPRRFMAGGHHLSVRQIDGTLRRATGRRLIVVPIPGLVLRGAGRAVDLATKVLPVHTVFTRAAMDYYTRMPPSDDTPSIDELGIRYRDPVDTFVDCIAGLVATGRVSQKQAGARA